MTKKPKIGDIFQIPLSNGKRSYGQYLHHSKMGPIIRVYNLFSDKATIDQVVSSDLLFPPVITGLYAAIKKGYWKVIGHSPILNFVHPRFVSAFYDQETGKAKIWFLWDGQNEIKIGPVLPEEYKKLEFLVVWNPTNVVQRIETRKIPFPYDDLINKNEYTPLK